MSRAVALAVLVSASGQVFAQAGEELKLEEVTVTARKVEENLMTVPLAITAMTAKDIEATGVKQLTDIMMMTPSFYFANQQGGSGRNDRTSTSLIFRGLYLNLNVGLQSGGQLFIDGAPVSSAQPPAISDVERVEVLKGPQSAYFGRSTFVGAINFVTREPGDEFKGRLSAEASSFQSYEANASVEGPLTSSLAGRVSVRSFERGGYYINAADPAGKKLGEQTTNSISGTLVFKPTDGLKIKTYANYFIDNDGPPAQGALLADNFNGRPQANGTCPSFSQLAPGVPSPGAGGNPNGGRSLYGYYCGTLPTVDKLPANVLSGDYDTSLTPTFNALFNDPPAWYVFDPSFKQSGGMRREALQGDIRLDWEILGGHTLTTLTAYHQDKYQTILDLNYRSGRDRPNPYYSAATAATRLPWLQALLMSQNKSHDWSQEVRITSPQEQRLRYALGFNYFNGVSPGSTVIGLLGSGPSFTSQINKSTVKTPATFGALYFDLTDTVTVSAEARYQKDKISQQPLVVSPGVVATGAAATKLSASFNSFSPRVSIDWEYAPDSILYALWSRGYRPGGFNSAFLTFPPSTVAILQATVPSAGLTYEEEQLDNLEVGIKSTWLDGRARTTLTLYKDKWKNGQVGNTIALPGVTNLVNITINNGIADLKGVEFEGKFQATRNLSLGATYALNDTEVKSYGIGPGNVSGNCVDCNNVYGSFAGVIGRPLPTVPRTTWTVNADYSARFSDTLTWYVRGDYMFQGEKYTDFSAVAKVGSRKNLNARIGLRGEKWSVEAFGTNLTDDSTMLSALYGTDVFNFLPLTAPGKSAIRFSPPIPRAFGVRASYEF